MATENSEWNELEGLEDRKAIEALLNEHIEFIDNKLKQIVIKMQEVSELLE